jgi:endonuclease YncB( thermonuclease family)
MAAGARRGGLRRTAPFPPGINSRKCPRRIICAARSRTSSTPAPQAAPTPKKAPAGKPWQRLDGRTLKADRWNDGDSFHVLTGDEPPEIVARFYFVDTPEAETAYRAPIVEQAAYFGITKEQAVDIAHEPAAFTEKQLAKPFTVWMRWRSALGRSALGRNYVIIITADGRDLNELLVENGLARIYGTKTALYDGRDSRQYLARLRNWKPRRRLRSAELSGLRVGSDGAFWACAALARAGRR